MEKRLILLVTFLSVVMIAMAQPVSDSDTSGSVRSVYCVRGAQYPRITPDHRAQFKVVAPEAKLVQIDLGKKYDLVRNEKGEWLGTTEPLGPGFHYYFLIVDGVRVADPSSESFYGCSMHTSGIEIPYAKDVLQYELADVPHGEVRMKRYFSKTANAWRRMFVYTPPCYEKSEKEYPVLYLQHGGGEDERGWVLQGRTDIILDNLIAQQKAVPMVIVMCDGNSQDFTAELLNDCIPFVEENYRVKKDRSHRALAGLSMGGIHTLNTVIPHPELFAYVGVFSSGWWAKAPMPGLMKMDTETYYSLLQEKKDEYNVSFKEFWISMGGKEDIAYENCRIMRERFDKIGIKYTYYETNGGHTWPVWRESLYQFAPLLFK